VRPAPTIGGRATPTLATLATHSSIRHSECRTARVAGPSPRARQQAALSAGPRARWRARVFVPAGQTVRIGAMRIACAAATHRGRRRKSAAGAAGREQLLGETPWGRGKERSGQRETHGATQQPAPCAPRTCSSCKRALSEMSSSCLSLATTRRSCILARSWSAPRFSLAAACTPRKRRCFVHGHSRRDS